MDGSRDGWEKGQEYADAHIDVQMQGYKDGRTATKTYGSRDVKMERYMGKKEWIESKKEKEQEEKQNRNTETSQKTDNE